MKEKTAITLIGGGLVYMFIGQGVVDLYAQRSVQGDGVLAGTVVVIGVVGLVRRGKDNYNERRDP